VTLLTSPAKEGNHDAIEMQYVVDAMTSAKGKIQRASNEKGSDIISFKQKFQPRRKIERLSDYDAWQSEVTPTTT